jgi:hypothetical protein
MTNIASTELIAELEHVIKAGSPERRIQILRKVTCLTGSALAGAG